MQRMNLLLLMVLFPWSFASANEDSTRRQHEISLRTGYITLASIDNLYSTEKYSGGNVFAGVSYKLSKGKNAHYFATNFSIIKRKPDVPQLSAGVEFYESRYNGIKSIFYELDYSYLRRIHLSRLEIFVSGNLLNSLNMSDDGNLELFYSSVGPGLCTRYTFNKMNFGVAFSLPLASYVLRNNYHTSSGQSEPLTGTGFIKENSRFSFIGDFFFIYADFMYSYTISNRFDAGFHYRFRYISDAEPRSLKSVSGLYSVGLTYKF